MDKQTIRTLIIAVSVLVFIYLGYLLLSPFINPPKPKNVEKINIQLDDTDALKKLDLLKENGNLPINPSVEGRSDPFSPF